MVRFVTFSTSNMGKQIHNDILPNFLKAFNYKTIWNLMPIKSKQYIATYHGPSLYPFCNQQDEAGPHLFFVFFIH